MRLSCTDMEIRGFKDFGATSLAFWGHVTSSVTWSFDSACGFILVVYCNHASILHRYGDMGPQRYWGHDLDLLGSRDVIGHVTIGLGICGFLLVVHWNQGKRSREKEEEKGVDRAMEGSWARKWGTKRSFLARVKIWGRSTFYEPKYVFLKNSIWVGMIPHRDHTANWGCAFRLISKPVNRNY